MVKINAIIIDLDGTLTNCTHRKHFIDGKEKDFTSFYEAMGRDCINEWCAQLINNFKADHEILLVTGRPERYRDNTLNWLMKQRTQFIYKLFMRPHELEYEKDSKLKQAIYENQIEPFYGVTFAVDDRKQVVDMWRSLGLICLQCDEGDF